MKLSWISSVRGDPALLRRLEERMAAFYGRREQRAAYQEYIDKREVLDHPFERAMAGYLCRYPSLLEIGCGSGRLYRTLRRAGFSGRYTGIEVADYLIEECKKRHPEASWEQAGAYDIPAGDYQACFSYGVLESLVRPREALDAMARAVRTSVVLLFPDFVESGQLGSQRTHGWAERKIWLPGALKTARKRLGPFVINLAPVALEEPGKPRAAFDAVYVSCKADIEEWAAERKYRVEYPLGRTLPRELRARSWAFAVVQK